MGTIFISSFAFDKKIEIGRMKYSQFETYWGILTNFFSFFMIVATAATLLSTTFL